MQLIETRVSGTAYASIDATGLRQFGKVLSNEARGKLSTPGIDNIYSDAVPIGQLRTNLRRASYSIPLEARKKAYLMVVSQEFGSASANINASKVSIVFSIQLFEFESGKLQWSSEVDTSTWVGYGLLNKNTEGAVYNSEYARQFFDAIALQLKKDGG